MNISQRKIQNWLLIAVLLMAAVIQARLIMTSAYTAIVLSLIALFFMLFHNAPVGLLMILMFLFPFSGTEAFKTAMAGIPGFKPLQLFSFSVFVVALLNIRNAVRLPAPAALFFGSVAVLFTITFLRSLPNLAFINLVLPEPLSMTRYILSEFFKPLIYLVPAVIMVQYVHTARDIGRIAQTINWSITILSVVIIGFYLTNPGLILDPGSVRNFYASSFGLHTNSIANYFILGFPFVLTDLFRGRPLVGALKIVVCAAGIALLFSRSAYFLFVLSFFMYLFISKRGKWLPFVLAFMIAMFLILPDSITQRASKGIQSRDSDDFFAGRVEHLWRPLLNEISKDYSFLLIGKGRFAMVTTDAHKQGLMIQALHPHNMYLEMILDAGIVGLAVTLALFIYLLLKSLQSLRYARAGPPKEYQIAVITSLLCFLLSGVTDRTFFPDEINGYLWMIAALAFVLIRHLNTGREIVVRKAEVPDSVQWQQYTGS